MDRRRGVSPCCEGHGRDYGRRSSPPRSSATLCSVIEGCHEIFDLRRAQEWTTALAEWCASQPDLVPYREAAWSIDAQILQCHGSLGRGLEEARQARVTDLPNPPGPARATGGAYYLLGRACFVTHRRLMPRGGNRPTSRRGSQGTPAGAGPRLSSKLAQGRTSTAATGRDTAAR
jgi:hypothetical protein